MKETRHLCDGITNGAACRRPAETYTLSKGEEAWEIDYCQTHARDMWDTFVNCGRAVSASTAGEGRRATHSKLTMGWTPERA